MKNVWKWILGIALTFVVLAVLPFAWLVKVLTARK
jgi:hypothetical protein